MNPAAPSPPRRLVVATIAAAALAFACGADPEPQTAIDSADAAQIAADTLEDALGPPARGRAACAAAGWTWRADTQVDYCWFQSDVTSSCPPTSSRCFCALDCTSDADCVGLTQSRCERVMVFEWSDGGHCSSYKVCVDPSSRGLGYCVGDPPNAQSCE
ncbi:MAG: hypothetical protein KC635_06290 [Myxococcales bacterium]|nr:hypothetical protein [Myxococcales bacterium]MCB9733265.1 hypothetical protein [Deltaproteobacteria bacterium]